jgi:hypothetical protein
MMKQAKNLTQTIADSTSDFAKRAASATSDAAKSAVCATTDLAKAIGPKRGLIGLGVIAVAVGGTLVARRLLRARGEAVDTKLDQGVAAVRKANRTANNLRNNAFAHTH